MPSRAHFRDLRWFLLCFSFGTALSCSAANFTRGDEPAVRFGVHEILLSGDASEENPFDTAASVTFTPPSGQAKTVQAFYDGGNTWRARVYVSETGPWRWDSQSSGNKGLDKKSGTFSAADSKLRGRLLTHPKNPSQWMTEDGRWFLNLNDTAYFWLSAFDAGGKPVTQADAEAYVRDVSDHGITSLRSFLIVGSSGFNDKSLIGQWRNSFFADEGMTRLQLEHFQTADERLHWLLDAYPGMYIQLVLFPMGCRYANDQAVWQTLSPGQRELLMRNIIARYAAYPEVFWLVVNDVHYGPKYPLNYAFAREVGEYFASHDPWRHPLSTGHARLVDFAFPDDDWVTYLHLENKHDLGASQAAKYASHRKPVFLGEDRYEQDHGPKLDPLNMDYWQRRLFWSWLLAGGSANYGGRWWTVDPYGQTGQRPSTKTVSPASDKPFVAALTGLNSVKVIRDYFEQRHIELSDFLPDDTLVKDADGATGAAAPKLMRRGRDEFLIYHPNSAADGQNARPHADRAPSLTIDLGATPGPFEVEWLRASDGATQTVPILTGGTPQSLLAPWKGVDCVLRLRRK
jgi:hypothetical protein